MRYPKAGDLQRGTASSLVGNPPKLSRNKFEVRSSIGLEATATTRAEADSAAKKIRKAGAKDVHVLERPQLAPTRSSASPPQYHKPRGLPPGVPNPAKVTPIPPSRDQRKRYEQDRKLHGDSYEFIADMFRVLCLRHPDNGHWNAYVDVPRRMFADFDESPCNDEITYTGAEIHDIAASPDHLWVGIDFNHWGDWAPSSSSSGSGEYKDLAYVVERARMLSRCIAGIGEYETNPARSKRKNPPEVYEGMARALWVNAFAGAVEELDASDNDRDRLRAEKFTDGSMSGRDWNDVAPETPPEAYEAADRLYAAFQDLNKCSMDELVVRANIADNVGSDDPADYTDADLDLFGHCLAMQAMGTGVSWFDDHVAFDIKFPSCDAYCYPGRGTKMHFEFSMKRGETVMVTT